MPGSNHSSITASSCQTCDSHGCCTLNDSPAAHGLRGDRVLIWELTVGALEAWVEACGHSFGKSSSNSQMQGVRALGADGFVGHPVPAGNLAVQLDGRGHGGSWRASRGDDGD